MKFHRCSCQILDNRGNYERKGWRIENSNWMISRVRDNTEWWDVIYIPYGLQVGCYNGLKSGITEEVFDKIKKKYSQRIFELKQAGYDYKIINEIKENEK